MTHPDTPVEALMTPQPVTVMVSDGVDDALALLERYPCGAAQVLIENRIGALVVLHGAERVGIVTQSDLLEHCRD